jgi:PKHD-type hydroxylase
MENPYIFIPEVNKSYLRPLFIPNFFSEKDCNSVIEIGSKNEIKDSTVYDQSNNIFRKSKNSWISYNSETKWIFEKLEDIVKNENKIFYKFCLDGFLEDLQYTIYDEKDSFYDAHKDLGIHRNSLRKISIVIMLSNPKDYSGGNLEIFNGKEYLPTPKNQGDLIIFPSFEWHRVTKIESGIRKTLVGWVSGPFFK